MKCSTNNCPIDYAQRMRDYTRLVHFEAKILNQVYSCEGVVSADYIRRRDSLRDVLNLPDGPNRIDVERHAARIA